MRARIALKSLGEYTAMGRDAKNEALNRAVRFLCW